MVAHPVDLDFHGNHRADAVGPFGRPTNSLSQQPTAPSVRGSSSTCCQVLISRGLQPRSAYLQVRACSHESTEAPKPSCRPPRRVQVVFERLFSHFESCSSALLCLLSRSAAIVIHPSVCNVDIALNCSGNSGGASVRNSGKPCKLSVFFVLGMNGLERPEHAVPDRWPALPFLQSTVWTILEAILCFSELSRCPQWPPC